MHANSLQRERAPQAGWVDLVQACPRQHVATTKHPCLVFDELEELGASQQFESEGHLQVPVAQAHLLLDQLQL